MIKYRPLHRIGVAGMSEDRKYLGETVNYISKYLTKQYEPKLKGLNSFLVAAHHYDYYVKYKHLFTGLNQLGDRHDRGLHEGIVKLAKGVYLGFSLDPESRAQFVIGFAKSIEELNPYLLHTSQGKVFIANFDYELHPHEMKAPPEVIFLNDDTLNEFQQDVKGFLEDETFYNGKEYKRGSLLYGNPGNGKTSCITWAATLFDKVFVVPPDCAAPEVGRNINLMCQESESKLIVIEDLDSLNENTADLLNFVDGTVRINKAYFIGTTNYPEKLHANILDRPSRFDLFIEVSRPDEASREKLLRHHLPNLTEEQYKLYAKKTKGLNASYFQEIPILLHRRQLPGKELTIDAIIEKCKKRTKLVKSKDFKDDNSDTLGFKGNED